MKNMLLTSIIIILTFNTNGAVPSAPIVFIPFDNSLSAGEGTSVDAQINGDAQFSSGIDGEAISFTGSSNPQAVVLSDFTPAFNSDHDMSIQFWFQTTQSSDEQPIIAGSKHFTIGDKDTEILPGFALFMNDGTWGFNVGHDARMKNLWVGKDTAIAGRLTYIRDNGNYLPINDGEWHQFTMTYNNDDKNIKLYFDGVNRVTYQTIHLGEFISQHPMVLGADSEGVSGPGDRFEGAIDNFGAWDRELSPEEIQVSYRQFKSLEKFNYEDNLKSLRVAVWNTMEGGTGVMGEAGISQTAAIIKENDLDLVLIQENYSCGDYISAETGYYFTEGADRDYRSQGSNVAIHSRFPMSKVWSKIDEVFYHIGTRIKISKTQDIFVASNWYPGGASAIPGLFEMHRENLNAGDSIPFFWGGDFNQNARARYSCKETMEAEGFVDAFRELYPDANANPGYTYNTSRIDFLYYRGTGVTPHEFRIVKEANGGFPSDHNLLICDFDLNYVTYKKEVSIEKDKTSSEVIPFQINSYNGIMLTSDVTTVELLNLRGQSLATIYQNGERNHYIPRDQLNKMVPHGIYLLKVESANRTFFRRISIIH